MVSIPTKAKELDILDQTIAALGPHSYLAPWLTDVRAEVEAQVRSDFFPSVSLAESRRQGEAIVAEARAAAKAILDNARAGAERSDRAIDEKKAEAARAILLASETAARLARVLSPR